MSTNYSIREIPGFPAYYASSTGEIFSRLRRGRPGYISPESEMYRLAQSNSEGYPTVTLHRGNRPIRKKVSILMMASFFGETPPGLEVMHKDNNPSNNAIDNLAWGTHSENMRQMATDKRSYRGGSSAKLSSADVVTARSEFRNGTSIYALAKRFGVGKTAMGCAVHGKTHKYIQ